MRRALVGLVATLGLAACSGAQNKHKTFDIQATTSEGAALVAWFDGDEAQAHEAAAGAPASPAALYVQSELAYHAGDPEAAFDLWVQMLREHPGHVLTRFTAARLYAARDEVVDFERRVQPLFAEIDYAKLEPLTRAYVSMLDQTVAFRLWQTSDSDQPFQADRFGFATRWLKTPNLSPWRLGDFETVFAPETEEQLRPKYVSPSTAVDTEINEIDVKPYWSSGITLYPGFKRSGVHYLETIATLEGDSARDYLLYGNFVGASKVWIDGEIIFDRVETGYETGKRYREIRLKPGTHRVLVKMAYQSGYRDWFDLAFIPTDEHATADSGLTFTYACLPDRELPGCFDGKVEQTGVRLRSPEMLPSQLEAVFVSGKELAKATDIELWLTMTAGYFGGEHEAFKAAWAALSERRPEFAAGWASWAEEVQTLWQIPSKLRDARALKALRKAHEFDTTSVKNMTTLGRWLTSKGEEREARDMLAAAKDAAYDGERLRSFAPLTAWAGYLDDKDWDVQAEHAWREVLKAEPSNCRAASKLQGLLYGRSDYQTPDKITPRSADCPSLIEKWQALDETNTASRIANAKRNAGRYPLRGDHARSVATAMFHAGDDAGALATLRDAQKRIPGSTAIITELADRAFAAGDTEEALAMLKEYEEREGSSGWLLWKRAKMTGEIPLLDLMPDGRKAAMEAVTKGKDQALSKDEAYFVMDFAARRYFPDGSKVTLTHTVVRVMTKGAIDRYAEQNLPSNARALLVRTIKEDGSVRLPEETAGKSTLSMPGLAEGDFVEVAYLEYDAPEKPPSAVEGVRFFFKMANISTLHSEYIVIGDISDFMMENAPPKPQSFQYKGLPAVRFLARDNPRPRSEPRTTAVEEYLPWVQMYRNGHKISDVETFRRSVREAILDSQKTSDAFEEALTEWSKGELGEVGSAAWLKEMFYRITPLVSDPSISARSFDTDVNHIVALKDGNTMLVLKTVLDRFGVPNDVFLVKSAYQVPTVYPMREYSKYGVALLRVQSTDGKTFWLNPDGPDAMFNAVGSHLMGQPAVCATCAEGEELKIPTTDLRRSHQNISVTGKLDASGNLVGSVTFTFDGPTGASIRSGLRSRTDETSRAKFVDSLAAGVFTGAAATGYNMQNELVPDEALKVVVEFRRDGLAREVSPGLFQIETSLFKDAVASAFGGLPERVTPMMVGFTLENSYHLDIELEGWSKADLASPAGERRFDSAFGSAHRTTTLANNKLTISAGATMPIQRVPTSGYQAFQRWALRVEQSSVLLVKLKK